MDGIPYIHPAMLGRVMRHAQGAAQARASAGKSSISDRERQIIDLRLSSPKRADAGKPVEQQDDAAHLPLFVAADEPKLI